ncbi:MAG: hypothetical protein KDA89_17520 [Planctomycetaceae bacterium]|nr:hypothetical protein [Planctomycetaceae bacterium]
MTWKLLRATAVIRLLIIVGSTAIGFRPACGADESLTSDSPSAASANAKAVRSVGKPSKELRARLKLTEFHQRCLDADGFPILSSERVSPYAHLEACWIIDHMLTRRPDIRAALAEQGIRLVIMAPDEFTTAVPEHSHLRPREYWDRRARGLGSTVEHPAVSCGEENLLCYRGDPYAAENILIHEFAHTIHLQGLSKVDPAFDDRLRTVYERALEAGKWTGKYAATNRAEYWAEGVQSWFGSNRENDSEHNHVNTRDELKEYDSDLADLLASVFPDNDWQYRRPQDRSPEDRRHLAGFDPDKAPAFQWPKELVAAWERFQQGTDLVSLSPLPQETAEQARSAESRKETSVRFRNQTESTVRLYWVDTDGNRKPYGSVQPGRDRDQHTFAGHVWLVTDSQNHPLTIFTADTEPGIALISGEPGR